VLLTIRQCGTKNNKNRTVRLAISLTILHSQEIRCVENICRGTFLIGDTTNFKSSCLRKPDVLVLQYHVDPQGLWKALGRVLERTITSGSGEGKHARHVLETAGLNTVHQHHGVEEEIQLT
jgi:hypothetical protein